MKITGTIVNYYFHCKQQCWLFANRINLENNSEDVHVGKVLHELKTEGRKNTEISIENIKVDKIDNTYVTEIKRSDSDMEAVKWQTLFYLKVLKSKGIERKGKIEIVEKKYNNKKINYLELNEELENKLNSILQEIEALLNYKEPPIGQLLPKCKKCAYYEYCFL
ncbi:CRISPR-associated protein Cas4 [Tissierella simiarum]|uniref:CRISPR-associated protein Cas4 n=1 Tax=Tissierella simiarum TaxID=2841534 RepID=UPI001FE75B7E|nr:CRISPR-associated protein Cas4 [Tissierella simiarum]